MSHKPSDAIYHVVGALKYKDESKGISYDFKGCRCRIRQPTSSYICLEVEGWTTLSYMIPKSDFDAHCVLSDDDPESFEIHGRNLAIAQGRVPHPIKKKQQYLISVKPISGKAEQITNHWFEEEPTIEEVKSALKIQSIKFTEEDLIEFSLKTKENTMAKQQTQELSVFEEQSQKLSLPSIPENLIIGGVEFSVEKIKKSVAEAKKITLEVPLPTDTKDVIDAKEKAYERLKEMKNQFVKTRTGPENFRSSVVKPLDAWKKQLKAQTDSYGAAAREGEDHCSEQISKYDNYLEEQARLEEERVEKLIRERQVILQSMGGIQNLHSEHWEFSFAPTIIVERHQIVSLDDDQFNEIVLEIKKQKEINDAESAAKLAKEQADRIQAIQFRKQMLLTMGYESQDNLFYKNGHVTSEDDINNKSEVEWMEMLLSHNTPAKNVNAPNQNVNPFANPGQTSPFESAIAETAEAKPNNTFGNPFAMGVAPIWTSDDAQPDNVESNIGTIEFGDKSFLDHPFKQQTLRVYLSAKKDQAVTSDMQITYTGDLSNSISFVMFKNL